MAAKAENSSSLAVNFSLVFTATEVNAIEDIGACYGKLLLGEKSVRGRSIGVLDSVAATRRPTISLYI